MNGDEMCRGCQRSRADCDADPEPCAGDCDCPSEDAMVLEGFATGEPSEN